MSKPETRSIVVERKMAHPPERVWRALTQSELIAEWLMTNDFKPAVGEQTLLQAGARDGDLGGLIEQHKFFRVFDGVLGRVLRSKGPGLGGAPGKQGNYDRGKEGESFGVHKSCLGVWVRLRVSV